jgi:hypothetical protein
MFRQGTAETLGVARVPPAVYVADGVRDCQADCYLGLSPEGRKHGY